MILLKILICIVEENIFVVIVVVIFVAQILKGHLNNCFKINIKQMIKSCKMANMLHSKVMKGNDHVYDLCRF